MLQPLQRENHGALLRCRAMGLRVSEEVGSPSLAGHSIPRALPAPRLQIGAEGKTNTKRHGLFNGVKYFPTTCAGWLLSIE